MASKHIFVTVGTTKFDPFISKVLHPESLKILRARGYGSINAQIGSGDVEPISGNIEGVDVSCFRFLPSISDEIHRADLVISHAGAGTCLEVLNAQKPLIAVVNGDLMDDHQVELAERLAENGHIIYCEGPEKLAHILETADLSSLTPFPPGQPQKFADFIDEFMGFKTANC